jgi:hypothetical protein
MCVSDGRSGSATMCSSSDIPIRTRGVNSLSAERLDHKAQPIGRHGVFVTFCVANRIGWESSGN